MVKYIRIDTNSIIHIHINSFRVFFYILHSILYMSSKTANLLNWATPTGNVPIHMCAQRRFRSACAFAQPDHNFHWAHFGQLRMQNFLMRTTKTLISLCELAGRPRGYNFFFMLNSTEHEILPADKSQITNNCKFFLAKHSLAWKFFC